MKASQRRIQHVYLRAGFGITLPLLTQLRTEPEAIDHLFSSSQTYQAFSPQEQSSLTMGQFMGMNEEEKKAKLQQNRQHIRALNVAWVHHMAATEAQLREKMTLFWHDHFAVRHNFSAQAAQQQINLFRELGLGSFRTLLHAVSKDPAMLRFLNNQQNRKQKPNENFAREVLELFTLGRGHYTEQDIREAARAFTGWSALPNGTFIFRRRQHDYDQKTFMGKTGNFGGEDILDMILDNPRTARYITEKLYRFFIHTTPDETQVAQWAREFFESDYDISALLRSMFTSSHFYEDRNMGTHIKSPIEYLVGLMRMLDMKFDNDFTPLSIQKVLGQILLQPPNVSGWPEGKAWIDSSSLLTRMKIPQALILSGELDIRPKAAFAGNEEGLQLRGQERRFKASINWEALHAYTSGFEKEEMVKRLADYFLQVPLQHTDAATLLQFVKGRDRSEQFKVLVMRLLGTPEFQLA